MSTSHKPQNVFIRKLLIVNKLVFIFYNTKKYTNWTQFVLKNFKKKNVKVVF